MVGNHFGAKPLSPPGGSSFITLSNMISWKGREGISLGATVTACDCHLWSLCRAEGLPSEQPLERLFSLPGNSPKPVASQPTRPGWLLSGQRGQGPSRTTGGLLSFPGKFRVR